MNPLHEIIGWLYDILNKLEWRMSPLEVLRTEKEHPGLIGDLATEAWQRKIVKDQLTGSKKEPIYHE